MERRVAADLTASQRGGVITWTLDAPARKNPVTPGALGYIERQCAALSGAVVVLRGAGHEAFCAGFDLAALAAAPSPTPDTPDNALPDAPLIAATRAMRHADATFVAAIGGYAIGAGVELACACDVRIAKAGVWFQIPAARLGVVYHADGIARMRAVFGDAGLAQLLLLGRRLDAAQALAAGAVLQVAAADEFEAAVAAVVDDLRGAAPLSLAGNRTLLRELADARLSDRAHAVHAQRRREAYASADHQEARTAVAQRRPPQFTGR